MTYRGYRIEPLGTFAQYKIMAMGSGSIPEVLQGTYTTVPMAKQIIDRSLDSMIKSTKRKLKNDKKESASSR